MSDEILVSVDGGVGIITLNRPRAINALNRNMIDLLTTAISGWLADEGIKAILMEGAGDRGFCAGGDVREVREAMLAGRAGDADQFFIHEYALNKMIATSPKPIIALTHGVVMGGGIGLAGHAQIRITTDNCKYAMPESAIGLMCDVGVNAILAKAPASYALTFALPGRPVGAGDALGLGLVDHVIRADALAAVRAALLEALRAGTLGQLEQVLAAYLVAPSETPVADLALRLGDCFAGDSAEHIVSSIAAKGQEDPEIRPLSELLATRCPTSLEVILQSFRAACCNGDISAVLENDRRLALWMIRRSDFVEGVRAVLVDKDNAPVWEPASGDLVDRNAISSLLK